MIWIELIASLLVGLGTVVGALPVLCIPTITQRAEAILLGLGGGVLPHC
ncbi:MAG: hypothetical protein K6T90_03310 [Leptolyngbyaceae cyanobacterium HOT.MB2.61]|nr:hypothetical protein [Leptolyngbyaceae cyanobacterium HOT.MB2.61]